MRFLYFILLLTMLYIGHADFTWEVVFKAAWFILIADWIIMWAKLAFALTTQYIYRIRYKT